MREIEFRGKGIENKWYYGSLIADKYYQPNWQDLRCPKEINVCQIRYKENDFSTQYCQTEVVPETIGQYTGLKDKNGKKIFEGDIIENDFGTKFIADMSFEDDDDRTPIIKGRLPNKHCRTIIGNIYDNPELLEEE